MAYYKICKGVPNCSIKFKDVYRNNCHWWCVIHIFAASLEMMLAGHSSFISHEDGVRVSNLDNLDDFASNQK